MQHRSPSSASYTAPTRSMSFKAYLHEKYQTACRLQQDIVADPLMVEMLNAGGEDHELVKRWMRDYGLFQGIEGGARTLIAKRFVAFARAHGRVAHIDDAAIAALFKELLQALFKVQQRSWMSATSKLLWCLYPRDIVIYDTFVHRTLVTLQCIDTDLAGTARIGAAPEIKTEADLKLAVDAYMRYQGLVRKLLRVHQPALDKLRHDCEVSYPYDIRIVDKLLWMIGDCKQAY
jgi:hypothetical protein